MLFKPRWARILFKSPNLRINDDKIKQIEILRKEYGLPHEIMAETVGNNRTMTRIVQRNILEAHKRIVSDASEKELWLLVLFSRVESLHNFVLYSVETGDISESEAAHKFDLLANVQEKAKERIEKMNSFEMLCDYIISLDEEIVGRGYAQVEREAPQDLAKRISDILAKD